MQSFVQELVHSDNKRTEESFANRRIPRLLMDSPHKGRRYAISNNKWPRMMKKLLIKVFNIQFRSNIIELMNRLVSYSMTCDIRHEFVALCFAVVLSMD